MKGIVLVSRRECARELVEHVARDEGRAGARALDDAGVRRAVGNSAVVVVVNDRCEGGELVRCTEPRAARFFGRTDDLSLGPHGPRDIVVDEGDTPDPSADLFGLHRKLVEGEEVAVARRHASVVERERVLRAQVQGVCASVRSFSECS